jgi:hypothetical protein
MNIQNSSVNKCQQVIINAALSADHRKCDAKRPHGGGAKARAVKADGDVGAPRGVR